jgi:hypothetical protein
VVTSVSDSGDAPPGPYVIAFGLEDRSGILDNADYPRLYYRWDSQAIDEVAFDGYLTAYPSAQARSVPARQQYAATLDVPADRIGHTLFYRILAYDDDNDRPLDRTAAWSPVYRGGTIQGQVPEEPDLQAGTTFPAVTHRWRHVAFPAPYETQPVLVAQIVSEHSLENAHIDVRSVTRRGFRVRVENDAGLRRRHEPGERVDWIATLPGDHGNVKAGVTGATVTHKWQRVRFPSPFAEPPILVAQIATERGLHNAHVDIRNLTPEGFQVRVEEDLRRDGRHWAESVHWIAVAPGHHGDLFAGSTGQRAGSNWTKISYPPAFGQSSEVLVVAQITSEFERTNSHIDLHLRTNAGFWTRVEADSDGAPPRGSETIHYLAIRQN